MLNDAVSSINHMEGTACCMWFLNCFQINESHASLHIACYAFGCYLMHRLDDDVMLLDLDVVAVHWPVGGYNSCLFLYLSLRQPRIEARLHISQNCQILECMHVHTPAHMCVCVCAVSISTPLPPSSLPASIPSLHQGWWGSVYGKCKESDLSCFIVSPLACNSSPFFPPLFPPGDPSLPAAEDPAVRSSALLRIQASSAWNSGHDNMPPLSFQSMSCESHGMMEDQQLPG